MSDDWRWADPQGVQRLVRTDELRTALANGIVPPNAPVWRIGWKEWRPANEVAELRGGTPNGGALGTTAKTAGTIPAKGGPEPPPPPKYVAVPAPRPRAASSADIPQTASTSPEAVAARAARAALSKKTMVGVAPVGAGAVGPPASPTLPSLAASPPATPRSLGPTLSASDALKRSLPAQPPSAGPTVVGVPAIADPRKGAGATQPLPAVGGGSATKPASPAAAAIPAAVPTPRGPLPNRSPAPAPVASPAPSPAATAAGAPKDKNTKRQTLILYGGAPSEEEKEPSPAPSAVQNAPPIVVPAPGVQPGKNAVTQAPPWGEGAVGIGPEIPKSAPTPRLKQDSVEEISGSVLLESNEEGPVAAQRLGPSPQSAVERGATSSSFQGGTEKPPPFRPRSVPPPVPKRAREGDAEAAPGTSMEASPNAADASGATSAERTARTIPPAAALPREMREAVPSGAGPSDTFPWMDPVLERFPQLRRYQEGRPKFFLPVMGGLSALGALLFLGILVKGCVALFSSSETTTVRPSASASASARSAASVAPSSMPSAAAAASTHEVVPAAAACVVTGTPRSVAQKALVPSGVEVVPMSGGLALGFAASPKDAVVELVDPSSLSVIATTKLHAVDTLKRVMPLTTSRGIAVAGDLDRRSDKLAGRRTVPDATPIDLGVSDGALSWAPHGSDKTTALWTLPGEGGAEALRGVAVDANDPIAYAVAFRRGGAIWTGFVTKDKATSGDLASVAGLGPIVGSPAIGVSGDQVLVAWADRASSDEPWGLRLQRGKIGAPPEQARAFQAPPGGLGAPFMSPSVVGLGHGRFLLVWTEGEVSSHQVRALTLDENGAPVGAPLTVSAEGINAGQGQGGVASDGRGLIAYLAKSDKGFEVVATSITCPPR